jgi:hypothetical protein
VRKAGALGPLKGKVRHAQLVYAAQSLKFDRINKINNQSFGWL